MGAFTPKNVVDDITNYVVRGYIAKAVANERYSYSRSFRDPGPETVKGFGSIKVVEQPERPEDDGYGDRDTVIVVQVDKEDGTTVYFRVDATMDSYGDDIRLQSDPYEVVPKEVQVTRFERP